MKMQSVLGVCYTCPCFRDQLIPPLIIRFVGSICRVSLEKVLIFYKVSRTSSQKEAIYMACYNLFNLANESLYSRSIHHGTKCQELNKILITKIEIAPTNLINSTIAPGLDKRHPNFSDPVILLINKHFNCKNFGYSRYDGTQSSKRERFICSLRLKCTLSVVA